jgi:hypothetical protein
MPGLHSMEQYVYIDIYMINHIWIDMNVFVYFEV